MTAKDDQRVHLRRRLWVGTMLASVVALVLLAPPALAAPGDLDTSFNGTGQVTTQVGTAGEGAKAITMAGGDYVVAGSGSDTNSPPAFVVKVAYYLSRGPHAGQLDTTVGDSSGTTHTGITSLPNTDFPNNGVFFPRAAAVDPETGDVLVAGTLYAANDVYGPGGDVVVVALKDGALDPNFATHGIADISVGAGGTDNVEAMVVDPSTGEIFVGGGAATSSSNGLLDFTVVALDPNGALENGQNGTQDFGSSGSVTTPVTGGGSIFALTLDGSDIVAAGGADSQAAVMRYSESGAPEWSSATLVPLGGSFSSAASVLVQPGSHGIVIGGTQSTNSGGCLALARLSSTGTRDTTFDDAKNGGVTRVCIQSDSFAGAMAQTADGRYIYLAGGAYDSSSGVSSVALARFSSDGVPDTAGFDSTGYVTSTPGGTGNASQAFAMLVDGDNPVLAGVGNQTTSPYNVYFMLERYRGGEASGGTAPINQAAPSISPSGPVHGHSRLSATVGTWQGATSFAYDWQRCTASSPQPPQSDQCRTTGDSGPTYVTNYSDANYGSVRVVITARNASGSSQAVSNGVRVVFYPAPRNRTKPSVGFSGGSTPYVGETFHLLAGRWTHHGPITYTYELWRCTANAPVSCAKDPFWSSGNQTTTRFDYRIPARDNGVSLIGHRLRLAVVASDQGGLRSTQEYEPSFTGTIARPPKPPHNVTKPSVGFSGGSTPYVGDTFHLNAGEWKHRGQITYQYILYRCTAQFSCDQTPVWQSNPVGDSSVDYVIPAAEHGISLVGSRLRLQVRASDHGGRASAAEYEPSYTGVIALRPPAPKQVPPTNKDASSPDLFLIVQPSYRGDDTSLGVTNWAVPAPPSGHRPSETALRVLVIDRAGRLVNHASVTLSSTAIGPSLTEDTDSQRDGGGPGAATFVFSATEPGTIDISASAHGLHGSAKVAVVGQGSNFADALGETFQGDDNGYTCEVGPHSVNSNGPCVTNWTGPQTHQGASPSSACQYNQTAFGQQGAFDPLVKGLYSVLAWNGQVNTNGGLGDSSCPAINRMRLLVANSNYFPAQVALDPAHTLSGDPGQVSWDTTTGRLWRVSGGKFTEYQGWAVRLGANSLAATSGTWFAVLDAHSDWTVDATKAGAKVITHDGSSVIDDGQPIPLVAAGQYAFTVIKQP